MSEMERLEQKFITGQDESGSNLRQEYIKKRLQNIDKQKNSKPDYIIDIQEYHKRKKLLKQEKKLQEKQELSDYFKKNWKEWMPIYGVYEKITNIFNDKELEMYASLKQYLIDKKDNLHLTRTLSWFAYQMSAMYYVLDKIQ